MRVVYTALGAVLLLGTAPASGDSGVALYEAAIRTMATLPIPPYISYRLEGQSDSARPMRVGLLDSDDRVWLQLSPGSGHATWLVRHRSRDFANAVAENKATYYTNRSFFDLTWDGAYHELHDGILFHNGIQPKPKAIPASAAQAPSDCALSTINSVSVPGAYNVREVGAVPHATASVGPSPCPKDAEISSDPKLRTIALLHVMGPAVYGVSDAGSTQCENGDPGRALHFTARSDPQDHQLRDAIVDVRLTRFCMLRFTEPIRGGTIEQHYGDMNGYWLQTDGIVWDNFDTPMPAYRYQPGRTFELPDWSDTYRTLDQWTYRIEEVEFPPSVPDEVFGPAR